MDDAKECIKNEDSVRYHLLNIIFDSSKKVHRGVNLKIQPSLNKSAKKIS